MFTKNIDTNLETKTRIKFNNNPKKKNRSKKKNLKKWRSRVSIPVPSACKADALPFELHPHITNLFQKKYIR